MTTCATTANTYLSWVYAPLLTLCTHILKCCLCILKWYYLIAEVWQTVLNNYARDTKVAVELCNSETLMCDTNLAISTTRENYNTLTGSLCRVCLVDVEVGL